MRAKGRRVYFERSLWHRNTSHKVATVCEPERLVSFTAVGAASPLQKRAGQGNLAMRVCVLPLLKCNAVPSSMQHSRARCILVPGLHMLLSASPCTLLLLACKLPPLRSPTAKTSHLTVRLMSDQLGRRMRPAPLCYDPMFQALTRIFFSLVCFSRLQLRTANIAREDNSNVFPPPPPMADSCSGASQYLARMLPEALLGTSCEEKNEVSGETNAQVAGSDFSVCRWCRFPQSGYQMEAPPIPRRTPGLLTPCFHMVAGYIGLELLWTPSGSGELYSVWLTNKTPQSETHSHGSKLVLCWISIPCVLVHYWHIQAACRTPPWFFSALTTPFRY